LGSTIIENKSSKGKITTIEWEMMPLNNFLRQYVITWFLLLSNVPIGRTFQPVSRLQHGVFSKTSIVDSNNLQLKQNAIINYRQQRSDVTVIHMGLMEDFLSGADATQREKENQQYITQLQQRVQRINELEASVEDLGDDELEQKTNEFRIRIQQNKEDINGPILEEAFAVVREAAWYVSSSKNYFFLYYENVDD
jgi:SecA DEAD-like domain